MNKSQSFFCTAAVALGVALPAVVGASTTYTVTADTSSITGTSGYMDLQFEPGPATLAPVVFLMVYVLLNVFVARS